MNGLCDGRRLRWTPATLAACLFAVSANAQAPLTPEQRRQAGASYDQGIAARAEGDNAHAASLFETADRIAPSPQALGNAIRSHRDLHTPAHDARAATLALRMLARYGSEPRFASYANDVIQQVGAGVTRVRVQCDECEVEVDHAAVSDHEFFLEPGDHTVVGFWGQRSQSRTLHAQAGSQEVVALTAPAGGSTAVATTTGGSSGAVSDHEASGASSEAHGGIGFLPTAVPIVGAVLTVGSAIALIWSGMDTLAGVPAYNANPTMQGLTDGQAREERTNILIGVTAALGGLTLLSLPFVRWHHTTVEAIPAAHAANGLVPGLTLGGRFE